MKITDYFCFTFLLCKKTKKYQRLKLFDAAQEITMKNLNISYYIEKMKEFEKIKFLLLSKQQKHIFDIIKDEKINFLTEKKEKDFYEIIPEEHQIRESLKLITTSKNEIDVRMTELLLHLK